MTKKRKVTTKVLSVLCAGAMLFGVLSLDKVSEGGVVASADMDTSTIREVSQGVDTNLEQYFDPDVVYRLTDTVKADTEISVIVSLSGGETVLDKYEQSGTGETFSEYAETADGKKASNAVARETNRLIKKLNRSGVSYRIGNTYDTLLAGFEIIIEAGDYTDVALAVPEATLIVGEEYEKCETEVVTNDVDVYDTGIFDSSASKYQGDGVVVAVLDTGLDYTHTAFSEMPEVTSMTKSDVDSLVSSGMLTASTRTANLTADDVYYNEKVPFMYDYADNDPDVFPINSEHGTHVTGIISGRSNVITGVAPNAQIASMKVFSDSADSAKTSWILAALEDCVTLGVDVINMSLGTACGFSREVDEENVNAVYDRIEEAGISLVCAAGNDYNATMGSEKNGSLGLTSNPDSGTVGSPSTYDAALSVASVSGVMTNYMRYGDEVIYFNEATDSTATTRSFVDDLLGRMGVGAADTGTYSIPYIVIPGIGRNSDYPTSDTGYYEGKIVLVKRGTTTFEEKIRIAMQHGALGIIIYNNVSGDISMSIGSNADAAACSISQDDGEMLASAGGGEITISRKQEAGPFISDFSAWGPTSNLEIKPEITAHGGDIYSCVPGGGYEKFSGTSMAAPNQTGVTALIRQYVKDEANASKFGLDKLSGTEYNLAVTATVNRLMMSTADIIYNKNAIPYAVRKQGAGLVNLYDAQESDGYIVTFDENGDEMDKTKLELGDDKKKSGVYEATFEVRNVSASDTKYKVTSLVQTEGVSETYTGHGDTTVSQEGCALDDADFSVVSVSGDGSFAGDEITVKAGGSLKVTVKIALSEEDRDYIENSFEHGMYVEGFITLEQLGGSGNEESFVDINVPFLAFYGNWTEAPIFDEEYYDTNVDEINSGLDSDDKLMADAYATRAVGGLYDDYIAYLGSYYFTQNPSDTQIAASKDHISMSNQSSSSAYTINSIAYVYAGLLRNVARMEIEIVEDSTGKTIYSDVQYNQRKSYGSSSIYASAVDMGRFSAADYNLKNNTQYTVTLTAYMDYGDYGTQKNERNTFSFPVFIDYEAPVVTGVEFRKEVDRTTNETSLFADIEIYDNHYAMAAQIGNVVEYTGSEDYTFSLEGFGSYMTPIYSSFNSSSIVTFELTDYMDRIKDSQTIQYVDGEETIAKNSNTFIVICYDYALNQAIYEIRVPDEIISMYLEGDKVTNEGSADDPEYHVALGVNETLDLATVVNAYPSTSWVQAFDYEITSEGGDEYVALSGQTVLALRETGENPVELTITANAEGGGKITECLYITVSAEYGTYTLPVVNSFSISGYHTNKAFYGMSSDEREIGSEGYSYSFGDDKSLSMYPSESVTLNCDLKTYFPDDTWVEYTVANSRVATVDADGTIIAQEEGSTTVTATVYYWSGERYVSQRSDRVSVTVKDPFTTSSVYLMSYKGLGGTVEIPDDRGITTIYQYAFSNYDYVEKDLDAGDVIDDEDPYTMKTWFIGEDTITEIIIPEGVKEIQGYAFAGLTSLERVVFPSTLTRIGYGAFYGCTSLKEIAFSTNNNIQFVNEYAFYGCESLGTFDFSSVVAIGKYSFQYSGLTSVSLPESCQTLGYGAFSSNYSLTTVSISTRATIKLDSCVFEYCTSLSNLGQINASVIPSYAFYGCSSLTSIQLGRDVSVINEYAFAGTGIETFVVNTYNTYLKATENGTQICSSDGKVLYAVAPTSTGNVTISDNVITIYTGAFAGLGKITGVTAENVTAVMSYAFAGCESLETASFTKSLDEIGDYAFYGCVKLKSLPGVAGGTEDAHMTIGYAAFAYSALTSVTLEIPTYTDVGGYAFCGTGIASLTVGDGVVIGEYAFAACPELTEIEIGDYVVIGDYAFYGELAPDYETWYAEHGSSGDEEYYNTYIKTIYDEKDYYAYGVDACGNEISEDVSNKIYINSITGEPVTTYLYVYNFEKAYGGSLESVAIGAGCVIGNYAFANNVLLTGLDLNVGGSSEDESDKITIGDYAFYNCMALTDVSFDNVSSVGAYAFSVTHEVADVMNASGEYIGGLSVAYLFEMIDGEAVATGYSYTQHRGELTGALDLTSVSGIGAGAFAYNYGITGVGLSTGLGQIGAGAFYGCENVAEVTGLDEIENIGAYAFAGTGLASVSLMDDATVGDGAFYGCEALAGVEGLSGVRYIGAYAFAGTALGPVLDVSGAEYIGDYAFADIVSNGVIEVVLIDSDGDGRLGETGENPFRSSDVAFVSAKAKEYEEISYDETFFVTESVFVSGGVLYQTVPAGYVLVSYPVGKQDSTYTVEDGTVRISADAFRENGWIKNVIMPYGLAAIGDKAFYGCDSLAVVVFTGYEAPALEEEYDENYQLYTNIAMTGIYGGYEGLGIVDYYMWSIGPANFFYGANFVDYIGKIENKLVMVAPVNGQGYDSFTYAQYFDVFVEGAAAASPDTLAVIGMIEALPDSITMSDADDVYAALAAYNALITEQQALVTNYSKLSSAYGQLQFLETLQQQGGDASDTNDTGRSSSSFMKDNMWGLIIALVILLAFVALLVYTILMKKRQAVACETQGAGGADTAGDAAEGASVIEDVSSEGTGAPSEDGKDDKVS